jgi:hypothetical protein
MKVYQQNDWKPERRTIQVKESEVNPGKYVIEEINCDQSERVDLTYLIGFKENKLEMDRRALDGLRHVFQFKEVTFSPSVAATSNSKNVV